MPNYYFMFHGLPASGKTTLSMQLGELLEERGMKYARISRDEIRTKKFGAQYHMSPPDRVAEIFVSRDFNNELKDLLSQQINIIDDNTNLVTAGIKEIRTYLPEDMTIVHVLVDVPLEVAKAQNAKRKASGGRDAFEHSIDRMHTRSYNHNGSKLDRWRLLAEGEPVMEFVSPEQLDEILRRGES